MHEEEVLDYLLSLLHLEKSKIIKESFQFVCRELKRLRTLFRIQSFEDEGLFRKQSFEDEIDDDRMRATAENIQIIIDFFSREGLERRKFRKIFPQWKEQREKTIKELNEISDNIKTSKQVCSTVQIVGGSIGAIGGACIIAACIFPPAAFVLPVWLGGAAATALLPAAFLPAAATSGLAIGGGIAAGAAGAAQAATGFSELAILVSQVDKAKAACDQESKKFEEMMKWFTSTKELKRAFRDLLGVNVVMEALFGDLKRFCGMSKLDMKSAPMTSALKNFIINIFKLTKIPGCSFLKLSLSMQAAILSVVFVMFIIERRNRFVLDCFILVQKLGLGLAAGLGAGVEVGRLAASAFMKTAEVVPSAVAKRVAVGLFAGVGIALDTANIVLNAIDLAEGSKSAEQDKILEVVKELKKEMESLEEVYRRLIQMEIDRYIEKINFRK